MKATIAPEYFVNLMTMLPGEYFRLPKVPGSPLYRIDPTTPTDDEAGPSLFRSESGEVLTSRQIFFLNKGSFFVASEGMGGGGTS